MKAGVIAVFLASGLISVQAQNQAAPYAPAPPARTAPSAPGQTGTLPPGLQRNQLPPGLQNQQQLPPGLATPNPGVVPGTNGSVPRFGLNVNGVVAGSNQAGPLLVTTNQSGLLTNQFGMLTNQFGPTNMFGRFTNRFDLLSNRFAILSNRFGAFSNRLGFLSNRFRMFSNRFSISSNEFGTNLVFRDEALTEQDRILVRQIRQELLPEIRRERAAIHLIARNSMVTIVGLVPSQEEEREFVDIVRRTPGVVDVVDRLQIAVSMSGQQALPQGAAESPQGAAVRQGAAQQGATASQQQERFQIHVPGTNVPPTVNPVPPGSRPSLPSLAFPYSTNGIPPGS